MTPQVLIARLDVAIAGYGQSVTLQRTAVDPVTGATTVAEEIECPAAVRNFGPQSLEAGESQEIRVVLSPTGLGSFGIPSRDDIHRDRRQPFEHSGDRAAELRRRAMPREFALPWLTSAR